MVELALAHDARFKQHVAGPGHPERPERLDAIGAALEWNGLLQTSLRIAPQPCDGELLRRIHTREYLERVQQHCAMAQPVVDEHDCGICVESYEIACLAAGAVVQAARAVLSGEVRRAFCAARPPGHHAERDRAMGFCLLANVALAAEAARSEYGLKRILILDWDVHHGNGTQHIFEADADVLFISLHGDPATLYPGTGFADERGIGAGEGFTLNIPMRPGSGDADYQRAFQTQVAPLVERFEPQLVLISAGFDAHGDDPLGNVSLTDDAFAWMTQRAIEYAERYAGGRIVSVLEGGYNLNVLRRCVADHVRQLAGE